jgi:hypothetical protein
MIVALLALVAASAGVGNAATSLITGKQVKDASLTGRFTWHTAAVTCGVVWRSNYTSVSRAGQPHPEDGSVISGMTDPGTLVTGATANVVQSGTFS